MNPLHVNIVGEFSDVSFSVWCIFFIRVCGFVRGSRRIRNAQMIYAEKGKHHSLTSVCLATAWWWIHHRRLPLGVYYLPQHKHTWTCSTVHQSLGVQHKIRATLCSLLPRQRLRNTEAPWQHYLLLAAAVIPVIYLLRRKLYLWKRTSNPHKEQPPSTHPPSPTHTLQAVALWVSAGNSGATVTMAIPIVIFFAPCCCQQVSSVM